MGRIIGSHGWDWASGEEHLRKAIELNPRYVDAYVSLGSLLLRQGRFDEGIEERKKGLALDPLSVPTNFNLGVTLLNGRRYEEAIEQFKRAFELVPNQRGYRGSSALAYWYSGRHEEAIEVAERWVSPEFSEFLRELDSGNMDKARSVVENLDTGPVRRARLYAMLGEKELAIDWLTKGVDERHHGASNARGYSEFDPLRDDPRFHDLLRRMNLEP